jgi:two-component system cell cycle sensor histidine kinase PleC
LSIKTSNRTDKNIVDRTRKRSATAVLVKDLRQRITSSNGVPIAFESELMLSFAENHRNAFVAMPLFIAIIAVIAGGYIGYNVAAWWFLVTSFVYGLLARLCHRYISEAQEGDDILPRWRRTFLLAQLMVALCWSIFALYGCFSCGIDSYSIIQFSTILVFQAITMMLSYAFGSSLLITSAPPTLALSLRFMLTYDPAHIMMGGILLGSQAFFYLMADRFKLSVLSIIEHKAEKETLIAELETAKSISEEARRRAEEANLAKSRFLATMSHELRTPLNAILGFSEVMQEEVLGPIGNPSYKEYVTDINNSGKHLLNVINEILDLSRIEAGRQELQEESIRLAYVVEEAHHMVQLKAKSKGIAIISQFEENLPLIWADERAVRQITLNLLSNALKFTPNGGTIWLKVGWTSSGGQYMAVKDTGPGIPEEEIPIVLSSFGQGSIAIKSAEQGTGLGLPIVQALMHMHDGKFELKSKLREGTEVIATFPRSRVLEVMRPVQSAVEDAREKRRSVLQMRRFR